jgi:hypothetical protein
LICEPYSYAVNIITATNRQIFWFERFYVDECTRW